MRVIRSHVRSFEMSPRIPRGDIVEFRHLDPENPAWFFGRDAHRIEGYFPLAWFEIAEAEKSGHARRDYDATELSVAVGDHVEVIEKYGAWILARRDDGIGWIPETCIHQEAE